MAMKKRRAESLSDGAFELFAAKSAAGRRFESDLHRLADYGLIINDEDRRLYIDQIEATQKHASVNAAIPAELREFEALLQSCREALNSAFGGCEGRAR